MATYGGRTEIERTADVGKAVYTAFSNLLKHITRSMFSAKGQSANSDVEMCLGGKPIFRGRIQNNQLQVIDGKVTPAIMQHLKAMAENQPGTRISAPNSPDLQLLFNKTPVLDCRSGFVVRNDFPLSQQVQRNPEPVAHPVSNPSEQFTQAQPRNREVDPGLLRTLSQNFPKESALHKIVFALKQGCSKFSSWLNPTQRSFAQDLRNINTLQQAKVCLSLLGTQKPGERSWEGRAYGISEKPGGILELYARDRGLILRFDKNGGVLDGKVSNQDFKNLEQLQGVVRQNPQFQAGRNMGPVQNTGLAR
jgi:hypothetical protein